MALTLETKRLILRPLSESDQDAMVNTIMSDMAVMYWLPYSDSVSTVEDQKKVALSYLEDFIKPWDKLGFGVWAVCIRETKLGLPGDFIGYCGFLPEQIVGEGPEIAYAISKAMWGKGVATESALACLGWIFTKPDILRAHAVIDQGNIASRNVLEKVGMRHKNNVDLYDSVAKGNGLLPLYSIERDDYLKQAQKNKNLEWTELTS